MYLCFFNYYSKAPDDGFGEPKCVWSMLLYGIQVLYLAVNLVCISVRSVFLLHIEANSFFLYVHEKSPRGHYKFLKFFPCYFSVWKKKFVVKKLK